MEISKIIFHLISIILLNVLSIRINNFKNQLLILKIKKTSKQKQRIHNFQTKSRQMQNNNYVRESQCQQRDQFKYLIEKLEHLKIENIVESLNEHLDIQTNEQTYSVKINAGNNNDSICSLISMNRYLDVLKDIQFNGINTLEFEVSNIKGDQQTELIQTFLKNLSFLRMIPNIQVIELSIKEINPHSYLLFSSYEPTQLGQIFKYTNISKMRTTSIITKIHREYITKSFKIVESLTPNEGEIYNTKELGEFNRAVYNISEEKYQNPIIQTAEENFGSDYEMNCQQNILQKIMNTQEVINKIVSVEYYMKSLLLKEQLESLVYFIKLMERNTDIKQLYFKSVECSTDNHHSIVDLSELMKSNLIKRTNFEMTLTEESDMPLLIQIMKYVKALKLKFPKMMDIREMMLSIKNMPNSYTNMEALQFHFEYLDHIILTECYLKLLKHLPNIRTVVLISNDYSSQYKINQFKTFLINVLDLINGRENILFLGLVEFRKGFLQINIPRNSINLILAKQIAQVLSQVKAPLILTLKKISRYRQQDIYNEVEVCRIITSLVFEANIVDIHFQEWQQPKYKSYFNLVRTIKLYNIYFITFFLQLAQYISINPKLVLQDLFLLDN